MLKICNVTNTAFRWQRIQILNHRNEDVVFKMLVRWHLFQGIMFVETMLLTTSTPILEELKQYESGINNGTKCIYTDGPCYVQKE
jgi:hypothetical protein